MILRHISLTKDVRKPLPVAHQCGVQMLLMNFAAGIVRSAKVIAAWRHVGMMKTDVSNAPNHVTAQILTMDITMTTTITMVMKDMCPLKVMAMERAKEKARVEKVKEKAKEKARVERVKARARVERVKARARVERVKEKARAAVRVKARARVEQVKEKARVERVKARARVEQVKEKERAVVRVKARARAEKVKEKERAKEEKGVYLVAKSIPLVMTCPWNILILKCHLIKILNNLYLEMLRPLMMTCTSMMMIGLKLKQDPRQEELLTTMLLAPLLILLMDMKKDMGMMERRVIMVPMMKTIMETLDMMRVMMKVTMRKEAKAMIMEM
jgi:hypothetical protein